MRNILFVSREKNKGHISPIVNAQGNSLSNLAVINYYLIIGKTICAYIKHISGIRKFVKSKNVDVIHAHYSFSGYTAALSNIRPVICSLMGSDIQTKGVNRFIIKIFNHFFWKAVIVKSLRMKETIGLKQAIIIPNGVNLNIFRPIPRKEARKRIDINDAKKIIVFIADPVRPEKNFQLALKAYNLLKLHSTVVLKTIHNVNHETMPYYLSVADVLLMTSVWEGSPNVIKEAMACNCPIVSTDVGDVREVIGETEGCYLTTFNPKDVAEKIELALKFGKRTNGRENIQHLDEKIIAQKLLRVYDSIV